ncbi:hypothetical protein DL93DRAFT_2154818 [Clavulina sp. PMI_390]|nr:hypothetical protein DL93DRAFT_2154818 [Clavulina sp. PMI_390]
MNFPTSLANPPCPRPHSSSLGTGALVQTLPDRPDVPTKFHEYVRPVIHSTLTEFCTNLTGIEQETVDKADVFPAVWKRFGAWIRAIGALEDPDSFAFLTCGKWDLDVALPLELARLKFTTPALCDPAKVINVKKEFSKLYGLSKDRGMAGMLNYLKFDLEGRHHSGIDDCHNIARIVAQMQRDGWKPSKPDLVHLDPLGARIVAQMQRDGWKPSKPGLVHLDPLEEPPRNKKTKRKDFETFV